MKKHIFLAGLLVLSGIINYPMSFAWTQETGLLPEMQDAITKGIAAAKQQNWPAAIEYFKQVQEKAPLEPAALFNLALAYYKAGNKDLHALAWFKVYLAIAPDAEDSANARQRIKALEDIIESGVSNIIQKTKKVLAQNLCLPSSVEYDNIAKVQIAIGDIDGAWKTVNEIYGEDYDKCGIYANLTKKMVESGKVSNAEELISKCGDEYASNERTRKYFGDCLLRGIAVTQAAKGNVSEAKKTIRNIKDDYTNFNACYEIFEILAEKGDIAGAKGMMDLFKENVLVKESGKNYDMALANSIIAKAQAKAGDLEGAGKSIELAKEEALWVAGSVRSPYTDIGLAQAEAGDIKGAKESLGRVKEYAEKGSINEAIVQVYLRAKDFTLAKEMIESIDKFDYKDKAYRNLAAALVEAGDFTGAKETAGRIKRKDINLETQSLIAKAEGKLREAKAFELCSIIFAQEELEKIGDPADFFKSLKGEDSSLAVRKIVRVANLMMNFLISLRDSEAKWQKLGVKQSI